MREKRTEVSLKELMNRIAIDDLDPMMSVVN
jgi:hypothetical protein